LVHTSKCIKFFLTQNLLQKTQGLTFLSWNLYDVKFQNFEHAVLFVDPKIVTGNAVRFV
jgi:hypothetical protein